MSVSVRVRVDTTDPCNLLFCARPRRVQYLQERQPLLQRLTGLHTIVLQVALYTEEQTEGLQALLRLVPQMRVLDYFACVPVAWQCSTILGALGYVP